MKSLQIFLLCLLCSPLSLVGQTRQLVQLKGEFGISDKDDRIFLHKYLERENQLLLVGYEKLQLIDVGNAKVLEDRHGPLSPNISYAYTDTDDSVISPDGRKMLILENADKKKGIKEDAWIIDLQTGKRLAGLQDKSPDRIRNGMWSKNGKTFISFNYNFIFATPSTANFSFWDGETLDYLRTVSVENPTWVYLSEDGQRFFAATGRKKRFFGVPYISDSRGVIYVWDTRSGQLEKTIALSNDEFNVRTSKISVSPDEKFLVFVNKHKSKSTEHRLLVWEMNGSINPKYEFKANPKIANSSVSFSPDAKYFALDAGKTLQIYETQTGEKRYELQDVGLPTLWLNDNQTLLEEDIKKMKVFQTTDGRMLYEQKLIYDTASHTTGYGTDSMGNTIENTETVVVDYTRIIAHPNGKMFMTYSNQYVKIFDARTGALLQTVISPDLAAKEIGFCQRNPKKCQGSLVWKAGWSKDGKTLYVINANRQQVSLWGVLEN